MFQQLSQVAEQIGQSATSGGNVTGVALSVRQIGAAVTAVLAALTFILGVTTPVEVGATPSRCVLTRTESHHSEGLDSWNAAYPRPLGRVRAVMVFLRFPDSVPHLTTAQLARDHIPPAEKFFRAASYGKFDPQVVPVPGFRKMPSDSLFYQIKRDWNRAKERRYLDDAMTAADPVVNFRRFNVVYFVADPDAPGVDADATEVVNLGKPLTADGAEFAHVGVIFEAHPPERNVFAHESAHTFDLPDLYRRPGDGEPFGPERRGASGGDPTPSWDTQVGDWDLMGNQRSLSPDLFAWHKWKLGWLDADQVGCAAGRAPTEFTLSPVEVPGGLKLVVVPTSTTTALAVEVRGALGNDRASCTAGVLLYQVDSAVASGGGPIRVIDAHPGTAACPARAVYPELADAPFEAGGEHRDPRTGAWVRVLRANAAGEYTVRVSGPAKP